MSEISEEIRYVMLFYYKKDKNAAQTCRQICEVCGADAVSEHRTQEWFVRFRSGNFDVKDRPRSGRPVTEKVDEILQLAGYAKKLDVWVPHELTQRNLIDRISISETLLKRNEIDSFLKQIITMIDRINICDTLLKRNEIEPFLKRMITGDEKWITYDNRTRKRNINRRDVVCHQDNARPHTSLITLPIQDLNVELVKVYDMKNVKLSLYDTCLYMKPTTVLFLFARRPGRAPAGKSRKKRASQLYSPRFPNPGGVVQS
ncbi:SETMR methyltransferase, partial [Acromyrmex insinuator]